MRNQELTKAIQTIPKVELHVHLKGATRPETILRLAKKNGIDLPAKTLDEMREWFKFTDFGHFLTVYQQAARCFAEPEDVEYAAREFLTEQARQNILYTELTYTLNRHTMPFQAQVDALNRAKAWAEETLGVSMNYVLDIPRNIEHPDPVSIAKKMAEAAVENMQNGAVALGLAGDENAHTVAYFSPAFDIAKEAALPIVPHAGEAAGPQSMFDAIEICDPPRIGHGVRCVEDENLMALLKERQIHLEVSPTSNVCLAIFDKMGDHSLPQIAAAGIPFSINSDDPPYFSTTLTDELVTAASLLDWSLSDVRENIRRTAEATLLPDDKKADLIQSLSK